jgi:2-dehydro-3-deoxygluconokinase
MARLVTFGEVMMRLTPPGRKKLLQTDNLTITYGGAEANVSCALAHWGLESAHVTSFPNNALGDAAIATLRKLNVSTEFMIKQEGRLGLYFVEAGAMNRATAITYDRLPKHLIGKKFWKGQNGFIGLGLLQRFHKGQRIV